MEHYHVWLLLPKMQTINTYREMMIAVIDSNHFLPCYPPRVKETGEYPVAFADLLKKIKHAAVMYCFFMGTYYCTSYAWSDSAFLANSSVGRHHIDRIPSLKVTSQAGR